MKKKLMTGLTGVAAAVALAGVASTASAMAPPYAICNFKGTTVLTNPMTGDSTTCWLTLTAKANCAGDVEVVAGGSVPGDLTCRGLFLGNFPWTGNAASIIAGGAVIDTDPLALGLPSVIDFSGNPQGGGTINNVSSVPLNTGTSVACAAGATVTVPLAVSVASGVFSYTGATLDTVAPHLVNRGCSLVL